MRRLTVHRRRILALVANGNTNAAIGRQLGIHRTTVDRHLAEIFRVLGACDRANAVAIGLRLGEIRLEDVWVPATAGALEPRPEPADGPRSVPLRPVGPQEPREGPSAPVSRPNSAPATLAPQHPQIGSQSLNTAPPTQKGIA